MTLSDRIRYAPDKERLQAALAEYKSRTGHLPANLPSWYEYQFDSEKQYTDALDRNFLLEMFPNKPVKLLYFANA